MKMSMESNNSNEFFQITSKSSSDTEDPIAHGLDPSLYSPNAPIIIENNNTAVHKTVLTYLMLITIQVMFSECRL